MSKPSKPAAASDGKAAEVPFEEALKKLEAIVEQMEAGELPLEELLSHYEEGSRLARVCQARLAEAELRMQQLEKTADGSLEAKPFDAGDINS